MARASLYLIMEAFMKEIGEKERDKAKVLT